jgi:dGTPase
VLGRRHAERINTLVCDIVDHSDTSTRPGAIRMSEPVREAADALRGFLFDRVYTPLNERPDTKRARHIVRALFDHYARDPDLMPAEAGSTRRHDPAPRRVADFVASMTDRFAIDLYQRLFVPRNWSV